jgi:hypothetical protein
MLSFAEAPGVHHNSVYLRNPAPSSIGASETLPVRGRYPLGGRTSGSGRQRQHSPHVSFSGNLEYLGETSTDDTDLPLPPPPDLILRESPPPPATADRNFSTFGAPSSLSNSYRSVLHSHPGSNGYAGVSTSLLKNSMAPSTRSRSPAGSSSSHAHSPSPHTLPIVTPSSSAQRRWGSPSFHDDDDRTTSTTSGSYVISPDDLRKDYDDHIHNDMIV